MTSPAINLSVNHKEDHGSYILSVEGNPASDSLTISVFESPKEGPPRCVGISSELLDKLISIRAIWDSTRRLDH